jgi:hypothetical protein
MASSKCFMAFASKVMSSDFASVVNVKHTFHLQLFSMIHPFVCGSAHIYW